MIVFTLLSCPDIDAVNKFPVINQLFFTHRSKTGEEVCGHVVSEVARAQQRELDLVVEGQLTDGHENSTASRWARSPKQSPEPFLSVHPQQTV